MRTITKEWLQKAIIQHESMRDEIPFGLDEDDSNTLAAMKLALASLEAEAVAYADPQAFRNFQAGVARREWMWRNPGEDLIPVFTAPPAPANAEPVAWLWSHRKHPSEVSLIRPEDDERAEGAHWSGWNCQALYAAPPAPVSVPDDFLYMLTGRAKYLRDKGEIKSPELLERAAAMLHGADGSSPVIPDDVRRMDWLVSKTVDVREPMVYGSHSLFWSQTITDEEDDYHATKLREQIDAAMEAEQAAAPQQEAKS